MLGSDHVCNCVILPLIYETSTSYVLLRLRRIQMLYFICTEHILVIMRKKVLEGNQSYKVDGMKFLSLAKILDSKITSVLIIS